MAGPAWQELPNKMVQVVRADFLRGEQGVEKDIQALLDEFDAKLTAIFARHAQGQDMVLPVSAKAAVQIEVRNTCIWFAGELETLIREGTEKAVEQGIEVERKSQLLYVAKVIESLPDEAPKRIKSLVDGTQGGMP